MPGSLPRGKAAVSIIMSTELKEMLQLRAERNLRTLTHEIIYLVETGLSTKSDQVRDTLHMIYKAQGGDFPADLAPTE